MSYSAEINDEALAEALQNASLLNPNQLARAKSVADSEQVTLDRALLKLGLIDEDHLLSHLALVLQAPHVSSLSNYALDLEKIESLSRNYCKSSGIAPIHDEAKTAHILTSTPANTKLAEELAFHLDKPVSFVVAPSRLIRSLLATLDDAEPKNDPVVSSERLKTDQETLRQLGVDGPVIRFVSEAFQDAVANGASDIHFEALEDNLRIRFRVNGVLMSQPVDHALNVSSVLARVKVMASMNVSERRMPQDGRITINVAGRKVDIRVSSVPTSFGESIACRILDPNALLLGWEKLGFSSAVTKQIVDIIEQPSGLFLVTGPTGSGKTTTLYTALSHLNSEDRKLLTIEDPIEYNLKGVLQVQVHEDVGMTFAKALRAFLRQDPNVVMIGEIRDSETAEIACRAALIGRMVLSSLHTNSPEAAVTRLVDLGVPEYVVKDVLRGTLGQRLDINEGNIRRLEARLVQG